MSRTFSDKDYYSQGFVQPTVDTYKNHVKMRTFNFIMSIAIAAKLLKAMGITKNLKAYFSDKAAAQSGSGMYMSKTAPPEQKYDAAHFCNCTFLSSNAISAATTSSTKLQTQALELEKWTSATSMQFKKANISSDKVIDTIQTGFKNSWLTDLEKGVYSDLENFMAAAVLGYLSHCYKTLQTKYDKLKGTGNLKEKVYAAALEAVKEQMFDSKGVYDAVAFEVGKW